MINIPIKYQAITTLLRKKIFDKYANQRKYVEYNASTIRSMHYGKNAQLQRCINTMMTSSNGIVFRVTGHLCGEFTGHRWIPRTKANDAELWYFLWTALEYTV